MLRTMLKSKIHRATVTAAELHHVGSVTIDAELMEAADLLEGEQVTIVGITDGARVQTDVVAGERGSGVLGIHGAAVHRVAQADQVGEGDLVTVLAYAAMDEQEIRSYRPRVVFVDGGNRIVDRGGDPGRLPEDSASTTVAAVDDEIASAETDDAAKLDALLQQPEA